VGSILSRAVERGELRPDAPIEVGVHMLAGAMFARHVAGRPADAAWLGLVIDTLWRGLGQR
jgi:Tetracyclin repressor-like, C-terminal domain